MNLRNMKVAILSLFLILFSWSIWANQENDKPDAVSISEENERRASKAEQKASDLERLIRKTFQEAGVLRELVIKYRQAAEDAYGIQQSIDFKFQARNYENHATSFELQATNLEQWVTYFRDQARDLRDQANKKCEQK